MSIEFSCPTCGRQFVVADDWAGMQASCKTCGTIVTVPGGLAGHTTHAPEGSARPKHSPRPQAPRRVGGGPAKLALVITIAVVAVGAVLMTAVGCWLMLGTGQDEDASSRLAHRAVYPSADVPPSVEQPAVPMQSTARVRQPSAAPWSPTPATQPSTNRQSSSPNRTGRPAEVGRTGYGPTRPTQLPSPARSSLPKSILEGEPVSPADASLNADLLERISQCEEPVWSSELPEDTMLLLGNLAARHAPSAAAVDSRLFDRGTIVDPLQSSLWSAQVDARTNDWEYKKGRLSIKMSSGSRVLFPPGLSRFVLLVNHEHEGGYSWEVRDLSTGQRVGETVDAPAEQSPSLFSPWGRYVAVRSRESSNAYRVFSFVTGESTCEVTVATRTPSFITIGGPHYLVSVEEESSTSILRIWDIRNGELVQCFTIPQDREHPRLSDSTIISPGGRYFCRIEGDRWCVYDLFEARCVGHAPLYEKPRNCRATAFSCDGSLLAAMLEINSREYLFVCDFQTGEIVVKHPYSTRTRSSIASSLQWLPDNSALLYCGRTLLDGTTGEPIWTFPETRSTPRQMISLKHMLTLVDERGGPSLGYVELPEDELTKVWEAIRGGGEAVDSLLPKLVEADLTAAPPVALSTEAPGWSVIPDGQKPADHRAGFEVRVAEDSESVQKVIFAAPATSLVAVQRHGQPGEDKDRNKGISRFVERHDLRSGEKSEEIPVPGTCDTVDVSPTGETVLLGMQHRLGEYDRLDVVRFAPRQHVVGWRPYKREEAAGKGWEVDAGRRVTHTVMLGDERVLTVSGKGKLAVWRVPECTPVYVCEHFGTPLAYSPTRKYMVGLHDRRLRVFECETGACRGELAALDAFTQVQGVIFRRDATEVLALLTTNSTKTLVAWNTLTGGKKDEYPLPAELELRPPRAGMRGLQWLGDRYLLLDRRFLIDLEQRAVVWRYYPAFRNSVYPSGSPYGAFWVATRKESEGPTFLMPMHLPSAETIDKIAARSSASSPVFAPGVSVRLDVQGFGEYEDNARRQLTAAFEARGMSISPSADLTVTMSARHETTGKQLGVTRGWNPRARPEQTFAEQRIMCRLTVRRSSGKELWSYERSVAMRSLGLVRKEDVQGELRREMEEKFERFAKSSEFVDNGLPKYLPPPLDETIAGASSLEFGREGPPPPDQPNST